MFWFDEGSATLSMFFRVNQIKVSNFLLPLHQVGNFFVAQVTTRKGVLFYREL